MNSSEIYRLFHIYACLPKIFLSLTYGSSKTTDTELWFDLFLVWISRFNCCESVLGFKIVWINIMLKLMIPTKFLVTPTKIWVLLLRPWYISGVDCRISGCYFHKWPIAAVTLTFRLILLKLFKDFRIFNRGNIILITFHIKFINSTFFNSFTSA